MDNDIVIEGIQTNNLKNISIRLKKNAINLVIGPSGSGKSSLVYETIAQIGQHEIRAMFSDEGPEPKYVVKSYSNMIAAIPIKQSNYNHNMRSTIGTYFGLSRSVALVYAAILGVSESLFTLNKAENVCAKCHGLGVTGELDVHRIVSLNTPLCDNPIRCWNKYKDFYKQILAKYCDDCGIDATKTIRQLTNAEKELILKGKSQKKYSIKYKKRGSISSRTTYYYGPLSGHAMMPDYSPSKQFYYDYECDCCHGKKYSLEHEQYKLEGISIGEFMTLPFEKLLPIINRVQSGNRNPQLSFALNNIKSFVTKALELHLGYLCFHRAIPTLSGGELQRLKMVQVFCSQLTGLLIVLDEPLAGLSGAEKEAVYNNILALSSRHTLLVVDHSEKFISNARTIYALGPGSGVNGGRLVDFRDYLLMERVDRPFCVIKPSSMISVSIDNLVYRYKGVKLNVPENALCLVTGKSGVGKSTLLREYFPQKFDSYLYIGQNPVGGNSDSSVATLLGVWINISEVFATHTNKAKKMFSNHHGDDGACPICGGSGFIEYRHNAQTVVRLKCEECDGTGFNKLLKKYHVNNKTIFDVWNMTVHEGIEYFDSISKKISAVLRDAASLMLGHLQLGQATSTLSGGENTRAKILQAAKTKAEIIGIDEPFRGLSKSEVFYLACFLEKIRQKGKTVVVADHLEEAEKYFSTVINLQQQNGYLVGEIQPLQ